MPEKRPNVLLICADRWSGLFTRPAGHPVVMTPTIAQMARNGVHFDRAYSACPICIPARRSLMTGLSPRNHGDRVFNEYLEMPDPEEVPTLPGLFREAGYQAHAVGKLHVYPQRDRIGFDEVILNEEGRHHLDNGYADDWELYLADQGYPGQEYAGGLSNNDYLTRSWHLPDHCHPTNWAAAQMCRTIRRRDHRKPGFWYLSFVGPHPPVWPPAAYLDLYRNLELDPMVCGDWSQSFEDLPYSVKPYMDQFCMRMAIPGEIDRARRAFYATITHIDHQIRMVLGTLREEGLSENTIVAFTADHGDMLGDHQMWAKGVMYEKSARVPLIIVPAAGDVRFRPGSRDHRLAELRDLMPTLLDLCGLEPPGSLDGISLAGEADRDHLYGEFREGPASTRMIRDRRHKLIYYPVGNVFQLFDLDQDPLEQRNLAGNASLREVQDRLVRLLVDHLYGSDLEWVREGRLVGLPDREYVPTADRGLGAQRGWRFL